MNDPEREAEEILREAYAEARAEACPEGDQCPVHFRVDGEYLNESILYARLVTYSGDYAVVTEDNAEYDNLLVLLGAALGTIKRPPRWETLILKVGSGVVGDLAHMTRDEVKASIRHSTKHDEWEHVKAVHEVTVMALREGMIDVSKPVES